MTDMLVMVPTRGRPGNAIETIRSVTSLAQVDTRLVFVLDEDDPALPGYRVVLSQCKQPSVGMVIGPRGTPGVVAAANRGAVALADEDVPILYLGDDHLPRTPGYDLAILKELNDLGTGWVYGNDLIHGPHLPTAGAFTPDIVRTLGWVFPPTLNHLYSDNAWLKLGLAIDRIRYLDEVVIEHMHPIAGKAEWDDGYRRVNQSQVYLDDRQAYDRWLNEQMPTDVEKLRVLL